MWFYAFMRRAKLYKPDFGESKRSKMGVIRAEKQSEAAIKKFFDMQAKTYSYHTKQGHFSKGRDKPLPCNVCSMDKAHADPEKKRAKKIGSNKRMRKFTISTSDRFPFMSQSLS